MKKIFVLIGAMFLLGFIPGFESVGSSSPIIDLDDGEYYDYRKFSG